MNLLKTDRTYSTAANATKALGIACKKLGKDVADVRYLIAVKEDGRFAPIVIGVTDGNGESNNHFVFAGVTWVG